MICEIDETAILNNISIETESPNFNFVPKIDPNISYAEFFKNHLLPNKPCILSNISKSWPCTENWVKHNQPNFNYLLEKYKDFNITVSNCETRKYNAHTTDTMDFRSYANYWYNRKNNETSQVLYLKDWHLKNETNEDFYTVPQYFSSDWLNEYFIEKLDDDYRFVYIGPTGTWTPFHADVFTSFSWSVNICGQKKWLLFPPGEEMFLLDNLGNLPFDVSKQKHERQFFEVIQEPGEAIFVPSGWHHQVWNLKDTISINHNWINGCNVINMWQSLTDNLDKVKKEISDCSDMDKWLEHCQLMLKTSYGLDFLMFYRFLHHIALKRINFLENNEEIVQFDCWILGRNHTIFDLCKIKEVLELFINHADFNVIDFTENLPPNKLMLKINTIITNI